METRRHRLRTNIYQASWNYQHRDAYPLLILVLSIALGLLFKSWWVGLGVFMVLAYLPHGRAVGFASVVWGLIWAALGGLVLSSFGVGAAVAGALGGFALSWVPMRASEQYWRDLEKDGGPYSD